MPRLFPFHGLVFDAATAGPLAGVTAPPYDVISDHRRLEYLQASPFSVVHLDLAGTLARNPLVLPLYAGLLLLLLAWVRAAWSGRPLRWDPPRWMPWLLAAAFVTVVVVRNVPGWTWASPV